MIPNFFAITVAGFGNNMIAEDIMVGDKIFIGAKNCFVVAKDFFI